MADRRGRPVGDLTITPARSPLPLRVFKGASYLALAVMASGAAAVALVQWSGACPRFDEGAVRCVSPAAEALAGTGLFVLLAGGLTIVPALLALAGLVFLVRDTVRVVRHRTRRGG